MCEQKLYKTHIIDQPEKGKRIKVDWLLDCYNAIVIHQLAEFVGNLRWFIFATLIWKLTWEVESVQIQKRLLHLMMAAEQLEVTMSNKNTKRPFTVFQGGSW